MILTESAVEWIGNMSIFSSRSRQILLEAMVEQTVPANTHLYWEGETADQLYFVKSGLVRLSKSSDEGKSLILNMYHDGDLFGSFEPYQQTKHQLNAQTMEPSAIGLLHRHDLEFILTQHSELAIDFMKWMSIHHRIHETRLRDLLMYGKSGALCSTLLRLANSFGRTEGDSIRIERKLTHTELSDLIGATRESVNRMLADLRKHDAVAYEDGFIVILDRSYLEAVCHCEHCPKQICRI